MKFLSIRFLICAILLCLLLVGCSAGSLTAETEEPVPTGLASMISGKVDVGGYKLYYTCAGQGSPTVILEAGGPDDSSDWELLRVYYGNSTRVCAYDRANLGKSDPAPKPRTFLDMTRDLHTLLLKASIEGPYILVGHSMGGMLVREYADQYPEDVVGLVLVDSAHPDMGARLLTALPPKTAGEPKSLEAWRRYSNWMSTSNGRMPSDVEGVDMLVSNAQVKAVKSLGDLPLLVISRSPNNPVMAAGMPSLPEETNAKVLQLWQQMQIELAGLSSNSTRVVADHSGHFVMLEEPRLVADAIRKLVDEYRATLGENIPTVTAQMEAAGHTPVLVSIAGREEWRKGALFIHKDISFTDPAGDAITVVNKVIRCLSVTHRPHIVSV